MSVNQFYLLLFGVSLFGGLSFVLLVEVCKLRHFLNEVQSLVLETKRRVCLLTNENECRRRQVEDLQAITSVHWEAFAKVSERLKLAESTTFFVVRRMPEAVSKPGEIHPFAADAFVTIEPEAAAA